jgi:dolichol-phosphate mannosyltransferase
MGWGISKQGRRMKKISFVIAVYHNENAVTLTYEKIKGVFTSELSQYDYEIVFVDDGSKDNSLTEVLALHKQDGRVKVLSFTRNFGQMAAMLAGFKTATGDAIINISADLQDPVDLIPQMIQHWQQGSEIVICHRVERADSVSSRFFSRLAYGLLRLAIPQIPPGGFDFVLIDRKAMDTFNSIEVRNRFFQGDLLWTGYRTSFIPYTRLKRTHGKSQYNFWKKLKNFADAILDASYLPIRLISLLGILTSLSGFLYMLDIIISWFFIGISATKGWAPIMVTLLIVGGLIMLMLGIIGEYVWRIYDEVRRKPNYIIREKHL